MINASRGTVVDIPALKDALVSGHLSGAAVDVYPVEPFKNGPGFETPLIGCPNTILTPHIGILIIALYNQLTIQVDQLKKHNLVLVLKLEMRS